MILYDHCLLTSDKIEHDAKWQRGAILDGRTLPWLLRRSWQLPSTPHLGPLRTSRPSLRKLVAALRDLSLELSEAAGRRQGSFQFDLKSFAALRDRLHTQLTSNKRAIGDFYLQQGTKAWAVVALVGCGLSWSEPDLFALSRVGRPHFRECDSLPLSPFTYAQAQSEACPPGAHPSLLS